MKLFENDSTFILFISFTCILKIFKSSNECPNNTPFLSNNICQSNPCAQNDLNSQICSINNTIIKAQWLNNIISFESKYRYGGFSLNSKGDLFIEFSKDNKRLFFGLKQNGSYYFKDNQKLETSTKIFTIINQNDQSETISQYESSKIFISLKTSNDDDKEYFLGLSTYTGYAELFDFENDYYSIVKAEQMIGYQIFSFVYSLLKMEENYICIYTRTMSLDGDCTTLTKLSFSQKELSGNEKLKEETLQNNMRNRIISSFIKDSKIIVFYLNIDKKYVVEVFDENLNKRNNETVVICDDQINSYNLGRGVFFKSIFLREDMTAFLYYLGEEKYPQLKVGNLKYQNINDYYFYYFEQKIIKNINEYEFNNDILKNDLIKIHKNRFSFISCSNDNTILYIVLFDLYNNDENLKTRIYQINFNNYYKLNIAYEITSVLYNNYLAFSSSVYTNSIDDCFSILIIFGYNNNTDRTIDISSYLIDNNINNINNNFIYKLKENITLDNNIFGYEIADKIKLITIPDEIMFYNLDSSGNKILLASNDILTSKYSFEQNISIEKTNQYYFLEYQYIITEPNYEKFNEYPVIITDIRNNNDIDQEKEFEPFYFFSKTKKAKFKLCYKYCSSCYYNGNSIDDQKCYTCLVNYDYSKEKSSNCVPEGYYRDKETGNILKCNENNSKFYFDKEENKTICFNDEIICPENFIYFLTNEKQCLEDCSYNELLDGSCTISNNNEIVYQELINNVMKDYQKNNEDILIFEGQNDFFFQITNTMNELDTLEQEIDNEYSMSMIDLGICEDILKSDKGIDEDTPLIILKYENSVNSASEKYVQYEVYNPYTLEKMDLSLCEDNFIDIYLPINIDKETINLYEDLEKYGYDLFNSNDSFYQDICTKYKSKNGTDVLLSDRRKEYFDSNKTLCQNGCSYSNYSMDKQYLKCTCSAINENINTKIEQDFKAQSLFTSFYEVIKYSNIRILKCYKLVFNLKEMKNNIGSIIMLVFFLLYLILLVAHIIIGLKPLQKQISNVVSDNIFIKNKPEKKTKSKKLHKKLKAITPKKDQSSEIYINKLKKINNFNNKNKKANNKSENNTLIHQSVNFDSKYSKAIEFNNKKNKSFKKNHNSDNFLLSIKDNKHLSDYQLNNLKYPEAIKLDKRSFCQTYISLLRRQDLILFTFFTYNDFNLVCLKMIKFILMISLDMVMNVVFFFDESMHKIYLSYGKYDFIQQIPKIIYSTIITQIIEVLMSYLCLTDIHYYRILENKGKKDIKNIILKNMKIIKIKIFIFLSTSFIFIVFIWYFISSFCAVYNNTQIIFIKDSVSSFFTFWRFKIIRARVIITFK